MATYSFAGAAQTIAQAGTTIPHAIKGGTPAFAWVTPSIAQVGGNGLYQYAASDGTNLYFANTTGSTSAYPMALLPQSTIL